MFITAVVLCAFVLHVWPFLKLWFPRQAGSVQPCCECVGLPVLPHKLDRRVEASEMIESGLVCTEKQAYTLSDNGKDAV